VSTGGFHGAGTYLDGRGAQLGQYVLGRQAPDAVLAQQLRDPGGPHLEGVSRTGHQLSQSPEPGLVGGRAEAKHLRKEAIELLPETIGEARQLLLQIVVQTGGLAQLDVERVIDLHPPEQV